MKRLALFLSLLSAGFVAAHASVAPVTADAHVCSGLPNTAFGTRSNLEVSTSCTAYLQFGLNLPSGTTSSQVSKAVMYVYVNRLYTTGTLSVAALTSSFTENTVTYSSGKPTASGTTSASATVSISGAYVAFDVTALVQGWVTTPASNDGVALTTTAADVLLDSKENDLTGHAAYLDITLANSGPAGTAATVSIGTVSTGSPGSSASVTNSGTSSAAVLNFTIPAGATGATGANGPQGPTGNVGTVTVTNGNGATGTASVSGSTLTINFPTGSTGSSSGFTWSGTLANVEQGSSYWLPTGSPAWNATTPLLAESAAPVACTVKSFSVAGISNNTQVAIKAEAIVYTLMKNETATSMACTINLTTTNNVAYSCSDSTHTFAVAANDRISIRETEPLTDNSAYNNLVAGTSIICQ